MSNDLLNILSNSNKDIDNQQLMDYLSGKLSEKEKHELEQSMAGSEFLNDAVEGLQKFDKEKDIRGYVEQLNATLQKSLRRKRSRREKRRLKDQPWAYLAIILVLLLCFITYFLIRRFQH